MKGETFSNRRLILIYTVWWSAWIVVQLFILHFLGLSYPMAITDSLISNFMLAGIGMAIFNTLRFYQPRRENRMYLRIWMLLLTVLCTTLTNWILKSIFGGNEVYDDFLHYAFPIRFFYNMLMICFISVLIWIWYFFSAQKEQEGRRTDTERLAREAELANLRQQLQPHFLFNSLNSISALVGARPEEARKMIQQLSDFLRGTLRKDQSQMITLEEELHHLELYLAIEKVRFGHRLNTRIEQEEACKDKKLPSLLLQPLVENAIKFGLYDTTGDITIGLHASCDAHKLVIRISNPFDSETARPRQGTGFGLSSVNRRLYLLYARNDLLHTDHQNGIFTTTITIPQNI